MYRLQAKLLALAIVASGAELGTNDRGLSNASDEVEGLFVRESNPNTRADAQLWKSAFLTLRANATLVPSRNGQPHDVPLYRNFGKDCRSAVRGNASAVRAELDAMEIDETLLDLTIRQTKHAFCPWLCRAFPNCTRVKCPSRQPPALAASCCV